MRASPAMKPVWTVRPIAPPLFEVSFPLIVLLLPPAPVSWDGSEVSVEDDEDGNKMREDEDEREGGVGVPVMLNCWDWARMLTPVGLFWTRLIWKPLPVGQPVEGLFTAAASPAERTFWLKTTLMFGYVCMFVKTIVKLEGSLETTVQETV